MIKLYQLWILLLPLTVFSQTRNIKKAPVISEDSMIKKWLKATINIEAEESMGLKRTLSGTAIFLSYHERYYMITARHVVEDKTSPFPNNLYRQINLVETINTYLDQFRPPGNMTGGLPILISRGNNYKDQDYYVFSSILDDIAVIDLSGNDTPRELFLDALQAKGYTPITISDIDTTSKLSVGENIIAIGFPRESIFLEHPLADKQKFWKSKFIKVPLITKGIISASSDTSNYFEGNIWVYHGNSGGPIIHKNKLAGIVSRGDYQLTATDEKRAYLLNHSIFIKSSLILPLLKELESKKFGKE